MLWLVETVSPKRGPSCNIDGFPLAFPYKIVDSTLQALTLHFSNEVIGAAGLEPAWTRSVRF